MKRKIVALELDNDYLKLAEVKLTARGRRLTYFSSEEIKGKTDEEIVAILSGHRDKLKIKKNELVFCFSRQMVTMRLLKLPSIKDSELSGMVEFQAIRQVPFSREEIFIDHQVISRQAGYSSVVLIIVYRQTIERYLKLLNKAKLSPSLVTLNSYGSFAYVAYNKIIRDTQHDVLILDFSPSYTEIIFAQKQVLIFSRSIKIGIDRLKNSAEASLEFMDELRNSHSSCEKELSKKISFGQVILLGPKNELSLLEKTMSEEFKLELRFISVGEKLETNDSLRHQVLQTRNSPVAVLGAAFNPASLYINLLPVPYREKIRKEQLVRDVLIKVCLIILAFFSFCAVMAKNYFDQRAYLSFLKRELARISPEAKKAEIMVNWINLLKERKQLTKSPLDLLREIYTITPASVYFSSLTIDDGKGINIQGMASKMSSVFNFNTVLENSQLFEHIKLKYVKERKGAGQGVTDFQISASLQK